MSNRKRFGRYHHLSTNNSEYSSSSSQTYFSELGSLCKGNNWKLSFDLDRTLFRHKHTSLEKVFANAKKTIEKSTQFINKIKSRQLACATRVKSIPENATIRKEYIKCGKEICKQKHGPYYYAYWKDPESKKLKKKYIGYHISKNQQFEGDYNNN